MYDALSDIIGSYFLRFDECDVSPFTVKALTAAGYVQMTKVQEATLSACLEGMLIPFFCMFHYVATYLNDCVYPCLWHHSRHICVTNDPLERLKNTKQWMVDLNKRVVSCETPCFLVI